MSMVRILRPLRTGLALPTVLFGVRLGEGVGTVSRGKVSAYEGNNTDNIAPKLWESLGTRLVNQLERE